MVQIFTYPAILTFTNGFCDIEFPDFPVYEYDIEEDSAEDKARELLYNTINDFLEDDKPLPKPSTEPPREVKWNEEFRVIRLIVG